MPNEHHTRILFCTDTLTAGGAERQLVELVTRLDKKLYKPEVICLHGSKAGFSLHFRPALVAAQVPVRVFDVVWKPSGILLSAVRLSANIWHTKPDILHTINHHSNHIARLTRLLLPTSMKLIVSIRTDYNARQLLYERLEHRASDIVVCNNSVMRRKLIERSRIPPSKVLYIPNGIDCARFRVKPDVNPRHEIAPNADRVLIMVARISRQKSPQLLAQAVGMLKLRGFLPDSVRILIIGEREDETIQAQLEATIQEYGLGKTILQLPATTEPELFYHAADATVLASLWEGMPNTVLESLAAGCPVVISEAANTSGIIEHGLTGWIVRTNDMEHLAETLRHVLEMPVEQLHAMKLHCEHRVAQFSIDHMVDRYHRLYERLRATPTPKI